MKAILTKPEKERLLEQFEKSEKTHAQFAEENGLNIEIFLSIKVTVVLRCIFCFLMF